MDPTLFILTVLANGAGALLGDKVPPVVRSAFEKLRRAVVEKLPPESPVAVSLRDEPASIQDWSPALAELIPIHRLDIDAQVLVATAELAKVLKEQNMSVAFKVNVTGDVQGLIQGHGNTVTQTFQAPPRHD